MTVGLTGGIGSGKSTVARIFELMGCVVFNSDQVARQAYFDPEVRKMVAALLGPEAYLSSSEIDRKYIAARVFANEALLAKLNGIIHPWVIAQTKIFEKKHQSEIIIKETALLFEAGLDKQVHATVVVTAPDALRIRRTMQRDGLTAMEAEARLKSQMPQEEKMQKADFVIRNDETELVIPQVESILSLLNNKQHVS